MRLSNLVVQEDYLKRAICEYIIYRDFYVSDHIKLTEVLKFIMANAMVPFRMEVPQSISML